MPTPTITSATLDKDSYSIGDVALLTVVRGDTSTEAHSDEIDVVALGADGTSSAITTLTISIEATTSESTEVKVTDSSGRAWSTASDDTVTAVLSATI